MTTEGTLPAGESDPPALHCYRHPDRETWVRCGRCDQPICSACAMQGPVGFRCRQCGRPARDPLTSMRPAQVLAAAGIAVLGGIVVGLVSGWLGIIGLVLAWFIGGASADAAIRFIGYKRGPRMLIPLFGGLLAGAAAIFVGEATTFAAQFGPEAGTAIMSYVYSRGPWAALAAGIACFGAWSRFRF